MTEDEREQLVAFVALTRTDLERALRYLPDDEVVNPLAREAWNSLQGQEFARLTSAITSGVFDQRLDAAGLSGVQGQFKLAVIRAAREEVGQEEQRALGAVEPTDADVDPSGRRPRRFQPLRRRIRKLLDAIDVVLDSLVSALHGIGEVLQEFKKALKTWLED